MSETDLRLDAIKHVLEERLLDIENEKTNTVNSVSTGLLDNESMILEGVVELIDDSKKSMCGVFDDDFVEYAISTVYEDDDSVMNEELDDFINTVQVIQDLMSAYVLGG